jgi:ribosomal-protein-alanine N-acetyltransferase
MKIREAHFSDIPSIAALEKQCETAAHWSHEQYGSAISDPARIVLVLEDRAIQGFLVARHVARESELENVVVAAAIRGRGLGSLLMQHFLAQARASKSETIFLEVRESNVAARKLYEKFEFVESGVRRGYYSSPTEDAIAYQLKLA